jgi:hypothetical protein
MEVAKRLNRGNKTKANNHQMLTQNNGWVMADNNLDKTNINNLNQNFPQRALWLLLIAVLRKYKSIACQWRNWLRFVKIQYFSPLAT